AFFFGLTLLGLLAPQGFQAGLHLLVFVVLAGAALYPGLDRLFGAFNRVGRGLSALLGGGGFFLGAPLGGGGCCLGLTFGLGLRVRCLFAAQRFEAALDLEAFFFPLLLLVGDPLFGSDDRCIGLLCGLRDTAALVDPLLLLLAQPGGFLALLADHSGVVGVCLAERP